MKYNLFTNADPDDGNAHCRHRTCRFCRVCNRLKILGCPCESSVGVWESDTFRHKKDTPTLLPTDGKKRKRRKSARKPIQVTHFCWYFDYIFIEEEIENPLTEPPVSYSLNFSIHNFEKKKKRRSRFSLDDDSRVDDYNQIVVTFIKVS